MPRINLGSLYLAESFALWLVGQDVDLVVVENPIHMYSTTSWPFGEVLRSTPAFVPQTARRPIVLNYPLRDAHRLLIHPLFAHELGHASVDEHSLSARVEARIAQDPDFQAWFQQAVASIQTSARASQTQLTGWIQLVFRDWIEELLCDALAIEITGPAFLWAFAGYVLPVTYGEPTDTHPPTTLRLRLMLAHLTELGWLPYLTRHTSESLRWLTAVSSDAGGRLAAPYNSLRDLFDRHAELIRQEAAARVGSNSLDPVVAAASSVEAASLLTHLILPVGLDSPLEPRSILLGGWLSAAQSHGDDPGGLVEALEDERLQGLVGKAIEMSTIVTAWDNLP